MAIIDEPPRSWIIEIFALIVSGVASLIMLLVGKLWKNQETKIEEMKQFHAREMREIREDVDAKHGENREDILDLHHKIDSSDLRAQDRHNELMRYLRDRRDGPNLQERY